MNTRLLITVCLALCGGNPGRGSQISDSINCFTLNMYKDLAKSNPNLISSPLGADVLLTLLSTTSAGQTLSQLRSALNYDDPTLTISDIKDLFKSVISSLVSSDGNTLNVANSVWIQNGFNVSSDFVDTATNYFNSYVDGSVEFQNNPGDATNTINNWSRTKTEGLIDKIFDGPLSTNTLMVLVNALYFKGSWEKKFNTRDTSEQKFFNNGNEAKNVSFMNQLQKFRWKYDSSDLKATILEMDYKGSQFSMSFVLPKDDSSLGALDQNLNCESFINTYTGLSKLKVEVSVPKFSISSNLDLKRSLNNLGIKDLFGPNADLSGLVGAQNGSASKLLVGDVVQKALVKVDEEGSVAAAVTAIRGCGNCPSPPQLVVKFKANRPFLYFIRHKQTGIILFIGRISSL